MRPCIVVKRDTVTLTTIDEHICHILVCKKMQCIKQEPIFSQGETEGSSYSSIDGGEIKSETCDQQTDISDEALELPPKSSGFVNEDLLYDDKDGRSHCDKSGDGMLLKVKTFDEQSDFMGAYREPLFSNGCNNVGFVKEEVMHGSLQDNTYCGRSLDVITKICDTDINTKTFREWSDVMATHQEPHFSDGQINVGFVKDEAIHKSSQGYSYCDQSHGVKTETFHVGNCFEVNTETFDEQPDFSATDQEPLFSIDFRNEGPVKEEVIEGSLQETSTDVTTKTVKLKEELPGLNNGCNNVVVVKEEVVQEESCSDSGKSCESGGVLSETFYSKRYVTNQTVNMHTVKREVSSDTESQSDSDPRGDAQSSDDSVTSRKLQTDMQTHTGGKPYTCGVCHKSFQNSSCLNAHMQTYCGRKLYTCAVCDQKFMYHSNLQKHMGLHTEGKPYTCDVCGKSFTQSSNLKGHMHIHTRKKPYTCNVCDMSFAQRDSLRRHLLSHTGERPYTCNFGEKSFKYSSNCSKHTLTHTGEKPHTCNVCHMSFAVLGTLKRHMRTHTDEKPHSCSVCGKSFREYSNLQQHMLIHNGKKPYTCNVCDKSFGREHNLKVHQRTHSGEKPFICNVCDKSFVCSHYLKIHLRTHSGERPHTCGVCNKSFLQSCDLKKHLRTHSGDNYCTS